MLPAIEAAFNVNGPKLKECHRVCDVGKTQFYNWVKGHSPIPKKKRQSVERAFGSKVDWDQYQREFEACERANSPVRPRLAATSPQHCQNDPEATREPKKGFFSFLTEEDNE